MDGSPASLEAGRHAVFLAQRAQAQLILLHVAPDSITHRLSFILRRASSEERRLARKAVDDLMELARASGVCASSAVEHGPSGEVIRRAAARFEVDLIVVSSTRSSNLHAVLGPATPDGAPLWSGRPVLVIMC
jgi:nucleotide-binding universal stress UspA family protein